MKPVKFYATIDDGKLNFDSPDWVRERMSQINDGKYVITIEKYFRQRSLSQNAYLHSVIIPMVYEGLRNAGFNEVKDTEDAKIVLKGLFLKKKISNGIETFEMIQDTHKLTTEEMAEFIDEVIQWAAMYLSITIPAPNQQLTIV